MKRLGYHIPVEGPMKDEGAVLADRIDWAFIAAAWPLCLYLFGPAMVRMIFN